MLNEHYDIFKFKFSAPIKNNWQTLPGTTQRLQTHQTEEYNLMLCRAIIQAVCQHMGVHPYSLHPGYWEKKGHSKKAEPKLLSIYFISTFIDIKQIEISALFGSINHTFVVYANKVINSKMSIDKQFRFKVFALALSMDFLNQSKKQRIKMIEENEKSR